MGFNSNQFGGQQDARVLGEYFWNLRKMQSYITYHQTKKPTKQSSRTPTVNKDYVRPQVVQERDKEEICSISNNLVLHKTFACTQFNYQTVLFEPNIKRYQLT